MIEIDESAFDSEPAAEKRRVPLSLAPLLPSLEGVELVDDITGRRTSIYKKPVTLGAKPEKAKAKKADYNELTRKLLKDKGFHPVRVDSFDHMNRVSHDLMGIWDFLALGEGQTLAVQITAKSSMSARRKKILESGWSSRCRSAGWTLVLIGWYKDGPRWAHEWQCL